jgi:tRNA dimethylallyltransferase
MAEPTPILVLTGQTASGKERLALAVAQRLAGEIVSADSMKVYRGMDVGTAKASPEARRAVPHHLVDVADAGETFSTARWVELADAAIADVAARGRVPIVSGGTMLYLKALLEGLFEGPAADDAVRARLSAEAEANGTAALHARLARVDPEAAGRIHPNDLRRIIRALEVWELAGAPISALQTQWGSRRGRCRPLLVAVRRSLDDLDRRIEARVRRMVEAGLVDEVRSLSARPGGLALGPRQALGYAEALEHLAGRLAREEMVEAMVLHTRQFARAQMKWLRRFAVRPGSPPRACRGEGLVWLDAAPDTPTDALADRVVDLWRAHAECLRGGSPYPPRSPGPQRGGCGDPPRST